MVIALILMVILAIVGIILSYYFGYSRKIEAVQIDDTRKLEQHEWLKQQIQEKEQNLNNLNTQYEEKKKYIQDAEQALINEISIKREQLNKDLASEEEIKRAQMVLHLNSYNTQIEEVYKDLSSLKAARAATIEAQRKEKEIAENPDKNKLPLSEDEIHDIEYLNSIRHKMRFPAVIGKVIWSSFIQKKATTFVNNLLGKDVICGIYKITNQLTGECYIGQSVNIQDRFKQHMKSGVGAVEVSNTNKLYAAMREDGIENFTFELLLECPKEDLNKQEKYFIELYQSDSYGFNSNAGVGKSQ